MILSSNAIAKQQLPRATIRSRYVCIYKKNPEKLLHYNSPKHAGTDFPSAKYLYLSSFWAKKFTSCDRTCDLRIIGVLCLMLANGTTQSKLSTTLKYIRRSLVGLLKTACIFYKTVIRLALDSYTETMYTLLLERFSLFGY